MVEAAEAEEGVVERSEPEIDTRRNASGRRKLALLEAVDRRGLGDGEAKAAEHKQAAEDLVHHCRRRGGWADVVSERASRGVVDRLAILATAGATSGGAEEGESEGVKRE